MNLSVSSLSSGCSSASLRLAVFTLSLGVLVACGVGGDGDASAATSPRTVSSLRLIGEQRIAFKLDFQGTPVGGLSGIDYDAASDSWVLISDDRSDLAPARLYTARLSYTAQRFDAVTLTGTLPMKQADGTPYPNAAQRATLGGEVPDFESVRIDPRDGSLWYASEGNRTLGLNPFVRQATRQGSWLSSAALPAQFNMVPTQELGPRNNVTFEGLSFAADGQSLWLAMESPLYQDGPLPTATTGAVSRITRFDRAGQVLAQYAYPIDPLPEAPLPGKLADNGVPEVLAVDERRLLVLERSGIQGADDRFQSFIRLYEVDVAAATDIRGVAALQGATYTPVVKRLVLNLNTLGLPRLDNIEGLAWGPRLPNGHDTLVMVSDDNFSNQQVTQFLAFEVIP